MIKNILSILRKLTRSSYALVIAPDCLLTDDELYDLAESCGNGRRKFLHTNTNLWRPFIRFEDLDDRVDKLVIVPLNGQVISETQSAFIWLLKEKFPTIPVVYTTMQTDITVVDNEQYEQLSKYKSSFVRDEMIKKAFRSSKVFK